MTGKGQLDGPLLPVPPGTVQRGGCRGRAEARRRVNGQWFDRSAMDERLGVDYRAGDGDRMTSSPRKPNLWRLDQGVCLG